MLKSTYKYLAVILWLVFTISLCVWWYIFHLIQIEKLLSLDHNLAAEIIRNQRMLAWEGAALLLSLIGGGLSLCYYIFKEVRQNKKIRNFFSTFSHELKTPLASLQLQAEALKEDLQDSQHSALIERIVADTSRLNIQLENSLFLANLDQHKTFIEEVSVQELVDLLQGEWPALNIEQAGNGIIRADRRILESIFKNIIQNAVTHGAASLISINVTKHDGGLQIDILDNGQGFSGDQNKLGLLYHRHYRGSGNGIGLYLCTKLAKKIQGDLEYLPSRHGFGLRLSLPGYLLKEQQYDKIATG